MLSRKMTKRMMVVAGSAAVMIAAGSARAADGDRATASAQQMYVRDARGGEPSSPVRTTSDSVAADGSEYVTHDELQKQIQERLEREQDARNPTPTFTDAG